MAALRPAPHGERMDPGHTDRGPLIPGPADARPAPGPRTPPTGDSGPLR